MFAKQIRWTIALAMMWAGIPLTALLFWLFGLDTPTLLGPGVALAGWLLRMDIMRECERCHRLSHNYDWALTLGRCPKRGCGSRRSVKFTGEDGVPDVACLRCHKVWSWQAWQKGHGCPSCHSNQYTAGGRLPERRR